MKMAAETTFAGKDRLYNRRFLHMCGHYRIDPLHVQDDVCCENARRASSRGHID
jgi:hypothetical protein